MSRHSPDTSRVLGLLRELHSLTANENGAQRVAFSPIWKTARAWFLRQTSGLPLQHHTDAAGNAWFTLPGRSSRTLIIGGHIDSVPNGGWLDGALNLLAGLEVVRRISNEHGGTPPVTIRLVDWADEEGVRFGRSLFGSASCTGALDMDAARQFTDPDGITLPQAMSACGLDFEKIPASRVELGDTAAYIELHIEQGPVLLDMNLPLGTVLGTFGVERHAIAYSGQAAHAGSTPMNRRRDALLAAAKMAQEIYAIADRHGGVCTVGTCATQPGIATSVAAECKITLDQRHLDAALLAKMLDDAQAASERFSQEGGVSCEWQPLCKVEPVHFHPELIALCEKAIIETCGRSHRLPSGPLHDASEISRAGIPTAMMFVQSLHGISHNKIEDTREEHIAQAVEAFDRLATHAIDWIRL